MQCSSIYPCPNNKVGINILSEIKSKYKCNIGFSDHTLGYSAAFAAAAAGATIIEKHFTISKKMYGSDAKHSMEPNDFKFLAKTIKDIWYIMMHPVNKNNINQYKSMRNIFQKSIVTKRYLRKGITLKISDIDFKKPGNGIKALSYKNVLGKRIKKSLEKDILLKYSDLK